MDVADEARNWVDPDESHKLAAITHHGEHRVTEQPGLRSVKIQTADDDSRASGPSGAEKVAVKKEKLLSVSRRHKQQPQQFRNRDAYAGPPAAIIKQDKHLR